MMAWFQWPQRVARTKISAPVTLFCIVITIVLSGLGVTRSWQSYAQHQSCFGRRAAISRAEGRYWIVYHHFVTGGDAAVEKLVKAGYLPAQFRCQQGGVYSIVESNKGAVMVHCSLSEHDENFNGSKGTGHRPNPSTDAPQP